MVGLTGQPGRATADKRMGGAPVTSRCIAVEGKTLERKNPGGARPRATLTPSIEGTDSQGEQSREVDQRHLLHS